MLTIVQITIQLRVAHIFWQFTSVCNYSGTTRHVFQSLQKPSSKIIKVTLTEQFWFSACLFSRILIWAEGQNHDIHWSVSIAEQCSLRPFIGFFLLWKSSFRHPGSVNCWCCGGKPHRHGANVTQSSKLNFKVKKQSTGYMSTAPHNIRGWCLKIDVFCQ